MLTVEAKDALMNELVNLDEISGELSSEDNFKVEMRRLKIKELLREGEEVEIEVPEVKAKVAKAPKAKIVREKRKGPKEGTKQAQANAIVAKLIEDGIQAAELKKQAIADIQNEVGMTFAGAQTYFYNALKALGTSMKGMKGFQKDMKGSLNKE